VLFLLRNCFCLFDRWRGSIYKLIWRDFLLYLLLYYAITLLYIYVLDDADKAFVSPTLLLIYFRVAPKT